MTATMTATERFAAYATAECLNRAAANADADGHHAEARDMREAARAILDEARVSARADYAS